MNAFHRFLIFVGVVLFLWCLVYVLFAKKYLPKSVARVVARIYFYPMLPVNLAYAWLTSRGNWWDSFALPDDSKGPALLLGSVPVTWKGHVDQLHALGVKAVVNLCDEYEGPTREYLVHSIEQLHLPTIDHEEPTVEDIHQAMAFIRRHRELGHGVYIHCKGGHGRSAAVAFCWLLSECNMSPQEAQEFLLSKRRVRRTLASQPNILQFIDLLPVDNLEEHEQQSYQSESPTEPRSEPSSPVISPRRNSKRRNSQDADETTNLIRNK